jgi:hypothetical protein
LEAVIVLPKGSINNLASIPPPFRNLIKTNAPHRIAAGWHDSGYDNKGFDVLVDGKRIFLPLSRQDIDRVFLEMMGLTFAEYLKALSKEALEFLSIENKKHIEIMEKMSRDKPIVGFVKRNTMYQGVRQFGGIHYKLTSGEWW